MLDRSKKLHRNFSLMFWIQALTSLQVINAISAIFMTHRGLTLAQIYYTAIVFSIVSLVFEIPSSYLADRWGRKKVIMLSCVMYLAYWVSTIFAFSFPLFALAIGFYACSNAMLSGTDEALLYDTSRELKIEDNSLKQLGKYFSGQRMFKIIVPIVAVMIAKNLSDAQFTIILLIDVVAALVAIGVSTRLEEPHHFLSVESIEAGIFKDAIKLFKNNRPLLAIMLNRTLLFVATFIMWRVNSDFFYKIGVPIIGIGFLTASYQSIGFFGSWHIEKILPQLPIASRINILSVLSTLSIGAFLVNHLFIHDTWVYLLSFTLFLGFEVVRWPLFSQMLNGYSKSYNRATVLSLANALKSGIDIPLLLLSALLVSHSYTHLFILALITAAISTGIFFLRPQHANSELN